jgi:Mor family transcriptional regulator
MGAKETDVVAELLNRLQCEFGALAPLIVQIIVESVGGLRIILPNFKSYYLVERNRRLKNEFTGQNFDELAIKYRLGARQVKRIVSGVRK